MSQKPNNHAPNATQLNERLDWMFVDLLTLTVGLLVMQVFILPALRASQTKGVPPPPGKWLLVELRIKGGPDSNRPPLLMGEWGIYLRNNMNQVTHGDDAGGTANPSIQAPQYGNDGSLAFVILPKDGESYSLGIWLQSLSEARLANQLIQNALLKGMEVRVRPFASSMANDSEVALKWETFDSTSQFHIEIPLHQELWNRP